MSLRKSYESLPALTSTMNRLLIHQREVFSIGNKRKDDLYDFDIIISIKNVNELCKTIYNAFLDLKKDYISNKVNLKSYKENLIFLKQLIFDNTELVKNDQLKTKDIIIEVAKVL